MFVIFKKSNNRLGDNIKVELNYVKKCGSGYNAMENLCELCDEYSCCIEQEVT